MHLCVLQLRVQRKPTHATHAVGLCSLPLEVAGVFDLQVGRNDCLIVEIFTGSDSAEQRPERYVLATRNIDALVVQISVVTIIARLRTLRRSN